MPLEGAETGYCTGVLLARYLHGGLRLGARGVAAAAGQLAAHAHAGLPVAPRAAVGRRRRHLGAQVRECLDDEIAKLE